jgi:succinate dehydrogenase/fumarate reductase flavoprotein subunit
VREGYSPREFEELIRQTMNYYMGYNRNQKGLEIALEKLRLIERYSAEIKATNPHELTRANEALHLLPYAQMMVIAVIKRGAFQGFYKRADVEANKEIRRKHVSLWRQGGAIDSCYDAIDPEK